MQSQLDRPEISSVLFYPRRTDRNTPPNGARDLDFEVAEGINIGCRLFTADVEAPVILFFHGNGETVPDYDDIGPIYAQQGLNFLITDYRGYGWSDGTPSAGVMLKDGHILFHKAKAWLQENGYQGPIFLMGRSLGSANAIDLAAAYNSEIKGLIIESGFAETLPLARTLGLDLGSLGISEEDGFNNKVKIASVTKPTFILHGSQDQLIPPYQAELLQSFCGARSKELQMMPRADHNSLIAVGGILYFQTIKRFIDRSTGAEDWRKTRKRWQEERKNKKSGKE